MDGLRVFFNRYVYFTIFIAFAAGILTARHIPLLEFPWGVLLGGLAVLLALWMLLILSWRRYVSERLVLGFLYALVFAGGLFYMWLHLAFMGSVPLSRFDGKSVEISGRVVSFPRLSENGQSFFLRVRKISTPQMKFSHPWGVGKVYVFIRGGRELPISFEYDVRLRGDFKEAAGSANRGGFSMREYLFPFGVRYQVLAPSPSFVDYAREANVWGRGLYLLKSHLVRQANRWFGELDRKLFVGLLLGDSAIYFPRQLKDTFRLAGLTHLLVVSGTQVSLLFLFISLLFLRLESPLTLSGRIMRVMKYLLALGFIFTYAVLTGFEPSIQRAFVVSVLIMGAHFFIYEADSFNLLGQAGIILLLMKPMELFSVSFQLTFAATLGLILALRVFGPYLSLIPPWGRGLGAILISTAGAQVLVAPFLALYFNQVSLWGLVSNLIAIPVSFFVIVLGLIFYLVSFCSPLALAVAFLLRVLLHFLYQWARLFAALPGSNYHFVPISSAVALGFFALLFIAVVAVGWSRFRSRWWQALGCVILAGILLLVVSVRYRLRLPELRVFYVASGSASAFIGRSRSTIVFADLPASAERQSSLLDDLYWLLSKEGAGRVSALVVLGGEDLQPGVLAESPLMPDTVVSALAGTVWPLRSSAQLPSDLQWFFNQRGEIAFFAVDLGRTTVLLPPTEGLRSRLDVRLPDTGDATGVRGERRVLVLSGAAARFQSSAVGDFLRANRMETIILQGRGRIPDSLLPFTVGTTVLTQAARHEIDVRSNGASSL